MGVLASLLGQPQSATLKETEGWFADWLGGSSSTDAGVKIGPRNALNLSTVWKCVRARGETFAVTPKKLREHVEILGRPGSREARTHPLFQVLHRRPNPTLTSMAFWEMLSADLDLWGNSFAYIERGSATGRINALWRIRPDLIRIEQDPDTLDLWYIANNGRNEERFFPSEIFHVAGLGFDGVQGYSPVRMLMNTLGWNKATEQHGAVFFKNASRPSGLVIAEGNILEPARTTLLEGLKKAGKEAGSLALIEGSLKYESMSMQNDEAQFVETLEYQQEDIAGIWRVPPHKIGILRRATNNNIEYQGIEWVRESIAPICERVEQAVDMQLLSDSPSSGLGGGTEQDRYFMKCDVRGLMRGDSQQRTAYYRERFNMGSITQNEIRELEDEEPFEGGDEYWLQMNMVPVSQAAKLATMPDEPEDPPPDDDAIEARIAAELSERAKNLYQMVFRDAVGRVMNRKPDKRAAAVPVTFTTVLRGLAQGLAVDWDAEFAGDYIGAMCKRAPEWADADEVSKSEFGRAVDALLGRSQ